MIQEYLFTDKVKRNLVMNYLPNGIERSISMFENSENWIVTYSLSHNDLEAAKQLSAVDEYVMQHFQPTVLTNESAAFFNKALYPMANEFERNLRKLLYLKSANSKNDIATDVIKDLEEKELGKIFECIFTDEDYNKEVRNKVKRDITWQFGKDELLRILNSIDEETLWDRLIGKNTVPTLRKEYLKVKDYRNDIMHAHNIDYSTYIDAKTIFRTINRELKSEIELEIKTAKEKPDHKEDNGFNALLGSSLMKANLQDAFSKAFLQLHAKSIENISATSLLQISPKPLADFALIAKTITDKIPDSLQASHEWKKIIEAYDATIPDTVSRETLDAIKQASEKYVLFSSEIKDKKAVDEQNNTEESEGEKCNGKDET